MHVQYVNVAKYVPSKGKINKDNVRDYNLSDKQAQDGKQG